MNEEIILNVESYNPYVIGAVAYVEQLENGAKITIVDKNGTTTATVEDGKDGKSISSIVLNDNYTLTINYEDGSSTTTGSIRGATGASGVFYGEEEPIDPAINVWVDPADGDGSVLKIRDEDDQWTTIESIVGEPAGFGTVTATVDANHGTPAVTVTTSGDDAAKNFAFAFSNLQPAPYDDSELQADFATLQGQFDTAVAAVTTDTEVTDIRVGADGITDTTAGASVRRQFTALKSDINDIEAVLRSDSSYAFDNIGFINANGSINASTSGRYTDYIPLVSVKSITYKVNLGTSGCGLAFFDESKNFVSSISILGGTGESGSTLVITDTIRNSATYFIASHYANTSWNPSCSVSVDDNSIAKRLDVLEDTYVSKDAIQTAVGLNKFDIDAVTVGKEVYGDGTLKVESNSAISDYIPVDGASSIYIKNLPIYSGTGMTSRSAFFYDASKSAVGSRVLIPIGASSYSVAVPNNADYFVFSIYQRASSSELPLDFSNVMLTFEPTDIQFEPYTLYATEIEGYKIKGDSDSDSLGASGLKVVIFGDSITETASMNDDGSNYVEGTRHNWPEYANGYMNWGSFKNYAKTGAAYKDRPNLEYRQSVSNQIAIAMADSNNDDADIIIFSLGTNDGTSSLGSYETAMGKATLADLDRTNLYEALRYAYWSIRAKYKNAVCFSAIPIQRADIEPPTALYEAIEKMAHRYDFIIIDGAYQSGIVKENNVWNASGNDLEDGLHPNTTGQIKMAKLYSSVILRNYLWRK